MGLDGKSAHHYWGPAGTGEEALLQQTQKRLNGLEGQAQPLLICNKNHRTNCCDKVLGFLAEQMSQIAVDPSAAQGAPAESPQGSNT